MKRWLWILLYAVIAILVIVGLARKAHHVLQRLDEHSEGD